LPYHTSIAHERPVHHFAAPPHRRRDASQPRLTNGGTLRSAVEGSGTHPQLRHGRAQPCRAGRRSPVVPVYAFRLRLWRKDQRWRKDKGETGQAAGSCQSRPAGNIRALPPGPHLCLRCPTPLRFGDWASAGISALHSRDTLPFAPPTAPAKRCRCVSRALSMRARILALGSPSRSSVSLPSALA